jgi:hypothetical protein
LKTIVLSYSLCLSFDQNLGFVVIDDTLIFSNLYKFYLRVVCRFCEELSAIRLEDTLVQPHPKQVLPERLFPLATRQQQGDRARSLPTEWRVGAATQHNGHTRPQYYIGGLRLGQIFQLFGQDCTEF